MAESAVIGALRVVLGADTATFESGLKKAQGQSESFARSVTKIMTGIGLERILEKGIEEVIGSFKEAIKRADDLGKAASKVGVGVEEFTALKVAADLSDVSMESLSAGLGKLSKAMVDVARGGGDLAFRQLGIEVTKADGSMRSITDVFGDVSEKFGGLKDGAAKTATAMALFGKGGKDLIPLLNEGKSGIEEMTQAAQRMGLVIGKDAAAQSQKFNDNLKLLQLAGQGLTNMVVAGLLPALVRLSDQWADTAKSGSSARTWADNIVSGIKEVTVWSLRSAEAMSILGDIAKLQLTAVTRPKDFIEGMQSLWDRLSGFPDRFKEIRKEAEETFLQIKVGGKELADLKFDANISKAIEDLGFKTDVLNQKWRGLAEGFPELAKGLGIPIEMIKTSVTALTPQLQQLNQAQLAFKGAQLTQDNLLPWQQYEQQIARINQLFASGSITFETYSVALQKAADAAGVSWTKAGATIAGSFATIAASFGESNSAMATAAKAFAIVSAVISAYEGAAKALTLPFPANLAAAATVLAQGFAFVAAIKTQAVPKFAHGGSMRVAGSGGIDSQLVQLRATPGEIIDVRTPGQYRDGGSAPTPVTINVANRTDRRFLEDIVSGIEDLMRDRGSSGIVLSVGKARFA